MKYLNIFFLTLCVCGCSTSNPDFNEDPPVVENTLSDDATACGYWRCSDTGKLYLQKYAKITDASGKTIYKKDGAYPLDAGVGAFPLKKIKDFIKQSQSQDGTPQYSLQDIDPCPYCKHTSVGECDCGMVLCLPPVPLEPPAPPQEFCITIDISGSMQDGGFLGFGRTKLQSVKDAAKAFVQNRDMSQNKFGIVVFSDNGSIHLQLSDNKQKILTAIDNIGSGGGTAFEDALNKSKQVLDVGGSSANKAILFFTDGENEDKNNALQAAKNIRDKKIVLVAVATADGDKNYLGQMTGDSGKVFIAGNGDIDSAFKQAEQKIQEAFTFGKATSDNSGIQVECPWCGKTKGYGGGAIGGPGKG